MPLENHEWKQDTTTHVLEWLTFKKLTTPNADEDAEQQGSHSLQKGIQNGIAVLEEYVSVPYKVKHSLPYISTNILLDIYSTDFKV